ncbi:MAG: hypothetical protein RLZZ271_1024 [Pseudomonadota bacterium]|jgi:hypothetical protein
MNITQIHIHELDGLSGKLADLAAERPNLVLVFAASSYFENPEFVAQVAYSFPSAMRVGCSTAGEITESGAHESSCVITAVRFKSTQLCEAATLIENASLSFDGGRSLADQLSKPGLRAVLVLGPGVDINGSELIRGLEESLGAEVAISGGLAGDGGAFVRTWIMSSRGVSDRQVVAIGLAGDQLNLGHGSFGGWQPFGPARKVTRSKGNILYELDGEPALGIYKRYLGDQAKDLPASGLLFPFAMLSPQLEDLGLIRTILGIDEQAGSLILAGDVDPLGYLKLMHASTDALVDGAEIAAQQAIDSNHGPRQQTLGVLVSCVGRKLVMGGRVDEEVDAVSTILGKGMCLTGFHSYGEIAPGIVNQGCQLHNQTMTITLISEA